MTTNAHCCKEVKARKGPVRWIGCKRKPVVDVASKESPGLILSYCAKHAPKVAPETGPVYHTDRCIQANDASAREVCVCRGTTKKPGG